MPTEPLETRPVGQLSGVMDADDITVPKHDPAIGMERHPSRQTCLEAMHLLTDSFCRIHRVLQHSTSVLLVALV
jgi:hypothetical protein